MVGFKFSKYNKKYVSPHNEHSRVVCRIKEIKNRCRIKLGLSNEGAP